MIARRSEVGAALAKGKREGRPVPVPLARTGANRRGMSLPASLISAADLAPLVLDLTVHLSQTAFDFTFSGIVAFLHWHYSRTNNGQKALQKIPARTIATTSRHASCSTVLVVVLTILYPTSHTSSAICQ
jgi:hypothetical protein